MLDLLGLVAASSQWTGNGVRQSKDRRGGATSKMDFDGSSRAPCVSAISWRKTKERRLFCFVSFYNSIIGGEIDASFNLGLFGDFRVFK